MEFTTIQGAKELGQLLQICRRFEVLAHLGVSVGVVQLAEIELQDGKDIHELNDLDSFQVVEIHEESEDGILASTTMFTQFGKVRHRTIQPTPPTPYY